ncbi:Orotate phosphoribosyltransferase [Tepidimonas sediminis]|uniref:Orotate phosphoribosyltransferase n=1 Tax=Tepidimonas sediminis TaxID=2588941 RepID=A0A554WRC0_9BURK|nr:phosphoribosyltransferase family protein [Tepidimonas sediminis]TSE26132.1 Orotate phosphoribosyltransferase [Tepidimonas sediminis]
MARGWRADWRARLPARCEVCGDWPHGPLCPPCRAELAPWVPRCPGCALPHPDHVNLCPTCQADPPPWRVVRARLDYAYPWDAWILRLKTAAGLGLADALAQLWLDDPTVERLLADADGWLPVPLAPVRLAQRGHNQAWSLMRALARRTRTPPARAQVLRRNPTAPVLHHLDAAGRRAHETDLFTLEPHALAWVRGRHLLVVDDVMTTGTTLRAASQALRQAGAASVAALVLARTPPPGAQGGG